MKRLSLLLALCAMARAQEINRVTLVVDKAHYSASAIASWSGAGALAAAVTAIPGGATATINVPVGYADTLGSAANLTPIVVPSSAAAVTFNFSAGNEILLGYTGVVAITTGTVPVTMNCSGPVIFDGQASLYSSTAFLSIGAANGGGVYGPCGFQNIDGNGIVLSGTLNFTVDGPTFTNMGKSGTIAPGDLPAILLTDACFAKVRNIHLDTLYSGDAIHLFGTSGSAACPLTVDSVELHNWAREGFEVQDVQSTGISFTNWKQFDYIGPTGPGSFTTNTIGTINGGSSPGGPNGGVFLAGIQIVMQTGGTQNPRSNAPAASDCLELYSTGASINEFECDGFATGVVKGGTGISITNGTINGAAVGITCNYGSYYCRGANYVNLTFNEPGNTAIVFTAGGNPDDGGNKARNITINKTNGSWTTTQNLCGVTIASLDPVPNVIDGLFVNWLAGTGSDTFSGAVCLANTQRGNKYLHVIATNYNASAAGTGFKLTSSGTFGGATITGAFLSNLAAVDNISSDPPTSFGDNYSVIGAGSGSPPTDFLITPGWVPPSPILSTVQTLTYGTTIDQPLDQTAATVFVATLTGNAFFTISGTASVPVSDYTFIWCQDSAGGHTVSYDGTFLFPVPYTGQLLYAANACTVHHFTGVPGIGGNRFRFDIGTSLSPNQLDQLGANAYQALVWNATTGSWVPTNVVNTITFGAGTQLTNTGTAVNPILNNTAPFPSSGVTHTTTVPCAGTMVFTNGLLTATTGTC